MPAIRPTSIVALYAWTASGRHHVADSAFLRRSEWTQLSKLISEATGGRLTLDLAGRQSSVHAAGLVTNFAGPIGDRCEPRLVIKLLPPVSPGLV